MNYKYIMCLALLLIVAGCTKKPELPSLSWEIITENLPKLYRVWTISNIQEQLYGIVISDKIVNLTTSIAGTIEQLSCQPGERVFKGQNLVQIIPSSDDVGGQNNFNQKQLFSQQLDILKKNLENLEKQKTLTSGDLQLQISSLNDQYQSLLNSKNIDLQRIQRTLDNTRKSIYNTVTQVFITFDQNFGVTNKEKNKDYDLYISAKNPQLRRNAQEIFGQLQLKSNKIITGMTNDELSLYLSDVANFLTIASEAINNSIVTSIFPQTSSSPVIPSIDGLYSIFTNASNGLLASKTNYDSTVASYNATENTYNNQINTLKINITNLSGNKSTLSDIGIDTQLNSLRSQIASTELQYQSLSNTLNGETLFAPFDGIVKSKQVNVWNKVAVNTSICQIAPLGKGVYKIQIFSPEKISLRSYVEMIDSRDQLVATGLIENELPFLDTITQTFAYELVNFNQLTNLKENDRLTILIEKESFEKEIWIPIDLVVPKLEGYFVNKKVWTGSKEIKVKVWPINNNMIQITSGLKLSDILIQ